MNSQKKHASILSTLERYVPGITFKPGTTFYWSPATKTVSYRQDSLASNQGAWSLLHETAHAILEHTTYETDFELLMLEVAAWKEATQIGKKVDISIDENYIQDCLDTYRDWLHRRSTCPTCGSVGLQHNASEYQCHNCHSSWHVTTARFCRPYRRKAISTKEKSPGSLKNQTTFR